MAAFLSHGLLTSIRRFRAALAAPLALMPILLGSPAAFAQASGQATKPASNEDVFLYGGMGSSYVCNARSAGLSFKASWHRRGHSLCSC